MVNDFGNCHDSDSQKRVILTLGCRMATTIRVGFTMAMLFTIVFKNGSWEEKEDWPGVIEIVQQRSFAKETVVLHCWAKNPRSEITFTDPWCMNGAKNLCPDSTLVYQQPRQILVQGGFIGFVDVPEPK